ncbi:hypothetical protein [Thalassomonas sp. M1454]|uniref:hypothetical protein n=1 Tax=Thalassomonas sp. M1454 TaxID=2594477 RepID=UPI00118163A1|nr:hypothetical protein [Thalassomonas sp. M1454]TRX55132.1 hypothetical protein FNN08_11095 [Thalassomonas sp. M1454]
MNKKLALSLSALSLSLLASTQSFAEQQNEQSDNLIGYKQSQFSIKSGFYTIQNGAKDSDYKKLDPTFSGVDDTVVSSLEAKSQFTWGATQLVLHHGLKNATNLDGKQYLANFMINTGFKPVKLYLGYDELAYDNGPTETKYRYGVGFGMPIKGQLVTGYLAKIYGTFVTPGLEDFEDDNGYALAFKTTFNLTDDIKWDSAFEYTWDRKLTSLPLPQGHPLREIAEDNLSGESYRFGNKISYQVSSNFDLGIEYVFLKGDAAFVKDAGLLGAFAAYKF